MLFNASALSTGFWSSRRFLHIALLTLVTVSVLILLTGRRRWDMWDTPPTTHSEVPKVAEGQSSLGCITDVDTIRRFGLTDNIRYARCEFEVIDSETVLSISNKLDVPLPEFQDLNLRSGSVAAARIPQETACQCKIPVEVPALHAKASASHIIFGMATTVKRIEDALDSFAHWAAFTNARLFALVEPDRDLDKVQGLARSRGINLTLSVSEEPFKERYFSLIMHLHEKLNEDTLWVSLIDDDTLFLSMAALVSRLSTYDAKQPLYIGGVTEELSSLGNIGYLAYGGAGIFLSIPLLNQLVPFYDDCKDSQRGGDVRLSHCIYRHTSTKLSVDQDLHQLDVQGDQSGFYESGRRQPLSIHHWKSWFQFDMIKMAAVAGICGEPCLLHRWRFSNGWHLSNGFSIVKYSHELPDDDVSMEQSWSDDEEVVHGQYYHSFEPLRPKDKGKLSFRLEEVVQEQDQMRQFYIDRSESDTRNGVVEIIWRRNSTGPS